MSAPVFLAEGRVLHAGDTVVLDGAEGHHAATVQRLRVGERVVLTDGRGASGNGGVLSVDRDRLEVLLSDVATHPDPQPRLTVVQALAKGDRGELAVSTMTEVGVDRVVPWAASRCVVRWEAARGQRALAKWRSTGREAAKQSRRAWFPEVTDLANTADVVDRLRRAAVAVVLHEEATEPVAALDLPSAGEVVVVVGPEGGISPEELAAFEDAGARACRLGPTVLRTSTAGPVALGVLLAKTARWS
ncbi:MAG: rRNA (uracil1498-N3)-methyltransferase [Actinomycetota bacterium]|nr:rRNA (uracil1498-N3)-methyltransferase [Actinomycetota bacterium]